MCLTELTPNSKPVTVSLLFSLQPCPSHPIPKKPCLLFPLSTPTLTSPCPALPCPCPLNIQGYPRDGGMGGRADPRGASPPLSQRSDQLSSLPSLSYHGRSPKTTVAWGRTWGGRRGRLGGWVGIGWVPERWMRERVSVGVRVTRWGRDRDWESSWGRTVTSRVDRYCRYDWKEGGREIRSVVELVYK